MAALDERKRIEETCVSLMKGAHGSLNNECPSKVRSLANALRLVVEKAPSSFIGADLPVGLTALPFRSPRSSTVSVM